MKTPTPLAKPWLWLLGLVLSCMLAQVPAAAAGPVQVGTNAGFVPFEFTNLKTHKIVGFDMDLLHAVMHRAGLKYKLHDMSFNGLIPALQAGSIDMAISGMTITPKRAKKVDFSHPYYRAGLQLLVRKGENDIHGIKDLAGKTAVTQTGTTDYHFLVTHKQPGEKIVPYPQNSQLFMALLSHNADAVLFDAPTVRYYAAHKGKGKVKTVGPLYEGQNYGMAFPKGSALVAKVNHALTKVYHSGAYQKIYQKWFGKLPQRQKALFTGNQ